MSQAGRTVRFLIVDDDSVSRNMLEAVIVTSCAFAAVCSHAGDGEEAVAAVRNSHETGEPFDCISMDMHMPGMDGVATLAAIREVERAVGLLPGREALAFMTTVNSDLKTVFDAFHDGLASGYVLKPFENEHIRDLLRMLGLA